MARANAGAALDAYLTAKVMERAGLLRPGQAFALASVASQITKKPQNRGKSVRVKKGKSR